MINCMIRIYEIEIRSKRYNYDVALSGKNNHGVT